MPEPGAGLRVLTWNVRSLLGDRFAVRRVIAAARADVVCLQEAPRFWTSRWQLRRLARDCGLRYVGGGREAGATAILASPRVFVTEVTAFRLPMPGRRNFPRGTVIASVGLPGTGAVRVATVHLPVRGEQRVEHLARIRAALGEQHPAVVCGDLNDRPGGPVWAALAEFVADPDPAAGPTFPSDHPRSRIDAVLTRAPVTEYDVWRADPDDVRRATDHRPVLAVLAL